MSTRRIGITGMAVNTPLGDTLDGFLESLLEGKSAISCWRAFETDGIYSKVGGDLSDYDIEAKVASLQSALGADAHRSLRKLSRRVAWSTRLSVLVAADAWSMSDLGDTGIEPRQVGVVVAGHNLNSLYVHSNQAEFLGEPDYIDPMYAPA